MRPTKSATMSADSLDLTAPILTHEGKPFPDNATLKTALIGSLLAQLKGDENMDGKGKISLFRLTMKLQDSADSCVLTLEEKTLLKDRVARAYAPMVVGRVWAVLDPASMIDD